MSDAKPVRCQHGKPLGYVTVLAKGLTSLSATYSKRQNNCCLHRMFSEEEIVKLKLA